MKDYQKQLEMFSEEETSSQTKMFFEKYWLDIEEYTTQWLPIKESIYDNKARFLPDLMFQKKFNLFGMIGGVIFEERDFIWLKRTMEEIDDQEFVVIQNYDENDPFKLSLGNGQSVIHPPLRFKFPKTITWSEINSGGGISKELFSSLKEYFIFGDSGLWGKYSANDYWPAIDIVGYKKEVEVIFKKYFLIPEEEREQVYRWFPESYKNTISIW